MAIGEIMAIRGNQGNKGNQGNQSNHGTEDNLNYNKSKLSVNSDLPSLSAYLVIY